MNTHFDAIVVGSGFGGSVSAYRLAKGGLNVCLLERGMAYPPNSFPRTQHGFRSNFWDPSKGLYGMFNVWSFKGIEALVSSGLGGGSLIYANVLIRKPREWFVQHHATNGTTEHWPIRYEDLEPHYDRVERMLNAQTYPFDVPPYDKTLKTAALKEAAGKLKLDWDLPNLAVTFGNPGETPVPGEPIREERPNLHGRTRYTCRLCGECDVGCNYGSKNTLDFNYLTEAQYEGADLRTLAEVRDFGPNDGGGYWVEYIQHDTSTSTTELRKRGDEQTTRLTCDRLIVSAGTLGSVYLLLKMKHKGHLPNLSGTLGDGFCGNGDLLSFALKCRDTTQDPPKHRDIGPTYGPVITSTIRVEDEVAGGDGRGYYIQDAGFPAFLTWIVEAANLPGMLRRMFRAAKRRVRAIIHRSPVTDLSSEIAEILGECELSSGTLPLLGMGRDIPDGRMSLKNERFLDIDWTIDNSNTYFERVRGTMRKIAHAWGAQFVDNPTYRLSRVITVHPLGGCRMGTSREDGVVDTYGEVFGYPDLYVADGSIMPGPTGPNPALTIAALADRTAESILRKSDVPAVQRSSLTHAGK